MLKTLLHLKSAHSKPEWNDSCYRLSTELETRDLN